MKTRLATRDGTEVADAASRISNVVSIPIARSINPVDAVGFTGFHSQEHPIKFLVLDADERGSPFH
jgi:hypothetical protein